MIHEDHQDCGIRILLVVIEGYLCIVHIVYWTLCMGQTDIRIHNFENSTLYLRLSYCDTGTLL